MICCLDPLSTFWAVCLSFLLSPPFAQWWSRQEWHLSVRKEAEQWSVLPQQSASGYKWLCQAAFCSCTLVFSSVLLAALSTMLFFLALEPGLDQRERQIKTEYSQGSSQNRGRLTVLSYSLKTRKLADTLRSSPAFYKIINNKENKESMFSLIIYFIPSSVYMSIPVSQFIPLSPFPCRYPYICSMSGSYVVFMFLEILIIIVFSCQLFGTMFISPHQTLILWGQGP